jgi:hypothetical protein
MSTADAIGALPPPPQKKTITLPGGGSLSGMVDLPAGVSESCRVNFNLLVQLGPLLGGLECLIRLFKFVGWLIDFVKAFPDAFGIPPDPTKVVRLVVEDLPPIAADLLECITAFTPLGICPPVKSFLTLIRDFLGCMLELLQSVIDQQVGIQVKMGEAQGNPELLEVLQLAQENADKMFAQTLASCEAPFALLETMGSLLEIVGAGAIAVPSIDDLSGGEAGEALQPLEDLVSALDLVIGALPC